MLVNVIRNLIDIKRAEYVRIWTSFFQRIVHATNAAVELQRGDLHPD